MRKKRVIMTSVAAVLTLSLGGIAYSATTAGTAEDPLVTKSYVDSVTNTLTQYIDSKIADFDTTEEPTENGGYEVLELQAGDTLLPNGGTKIILRSGLAKIIASVNGGISDTTDGVDLPMDADVPANHLLIIPRTDGRGISCTTHVFVMVEGGYEIVSAE